MFSWFKRSPNVYRQRELVGDLDLLTKKKYVIRLGAQEWLCPELTVREFAEFCALTDKVEKLSALREAKYVFEVEAAYDRIIELCIPAMSKRFRRKLSMVDATALILAILKRHGVEIEKKKEP